MGQVKKGWTIMVYMAGDNNLNTEMAYAIESIQKALFDPQLGNGNNPNLDLYVYYDGFSSQIPTLYCDFSYPDGKQVPVRFYRSSKIEDKLIRHTQDFGAENENSASIENIINFVDWCVKHDHFIDDNGAEVDYRADKKYAMIFSGHTFGFMDWGMFKDENADYYMTLSKLKWMFERITFKKQQLLQIAQNQQEEINENWSDEKLFERTFEILGKPFDLLGFDSCEMSTLEIGSQFKGLTKSIVASEGSVPNAGWNYAEILLGKIKEDPDADTLKIAVNIVEEFIKKQNNFAIADLSVDMSAWNMETLPALETAFGNFAQSLSNCFSDPNSISFQQMRRLLVQVHWHCQTYLLEQHVDLGDLCHLIAREIELLEKEIDPEKIPEIMAVREKCVELLTKLRDCVLVSGFSGSDFQFSNGISLFFPWSWASYVSAQKDYEKLSFIKYDENGNKWNQFLKKYLKDVSMRRAKTLTPKDNNGNIIIDPQINSVVFKSYEIIDEVLDEENAAADQKIKTKRPPDGNRRPPDGNRRPPDGNRRPPDGPRMFSNMNIFLSRFMKLKNFEPKWNHSGFTTTPKKVEINTMPKLGSPPKVVHNDPAILASLVIPGGTQVTVTVDDIMEQMNFLKEKAPQDFNFDSFSNILKEVSELEDRKASVEILANLSKSNLLKASEKKEADINKEIANTFTEAFNVIKNKTIKEKLMTQVDSFK